MALPLRHIVNLLGGASWAQIQSNIQDYCKELWATGLKRVDMAQAKDRKKPT